MRGVYYMYFGVFFLGDVFRVFDFLGFDKFGFWLYFCFIRNGQIFYKMSFYIFYNIFENVIFNICKTILLYSIKEIKIV